MTRVECVKKKSSRYLQEKHANRREIPALWLNPDRKIPGGK